MHFKKINNTELNNHNHKILELFHYKLYCNLIYNNLFIFYLVLLYILYEISFL